MNVGVSNRDLLPPAVAEELEMLVARIRAGWNVEHNSNGLHTNITAQTVNVSGLISAGTDPLQGTATTFARKFRLVYLSTAQSGSEAVGSAVIQQNVATVGSAQGLGSASRAAHPSGVVALLIGGGGGASVIGQGSVTQMRGLLATVHTESGAGGATDAMALRCDVIGRVSGTGTITNGYGLYINHGTIGITNRWGVYQATSGVPNFFQGKMRVGGVDSTVSGVPLVISDPSFPGVTFYESGASSNNKYWEHLTIATQHRLDLIDDAYSTRVQFFTCLRAGTVPAQFVINDAARGTGANAGRTCVIGRNTSGNGAPGCVQIVDRTGASWFLWVDTTGDVRVGNAAPTETSGDLIGTVVGTQT